MTDAEQGVSSWLGNGRSLPVFEVLAFEQSDWPLSSLFGTNSEIEGLIAIPALSRMAKIDLATSGARASVLTHVHPDVR